MDVEGIKALSFVLGQFAGFGLVVWQLQRLVIRSDNHGKALIALITIHNHNHPKDKITFES